MRRLAAVGSMIAALALAQPGSVPSATGRGRALFHGGEALNGTLIGLSMQLPAETVRCANCHTGPGDQPASGSSAPALNASLLTTMRERRGAPPSRFTRESFCRLLRTGVDPAHVVIVREMPRYELDDEQCGALWSYVSGPDPS